MDSFPLFRLPLVPIRPILDMIDFSDRMILSMTSKETYRILKTAGKSVSLDTLSDQQMIKQNVLEMIHFLLLENNIDSEEFCKKYRPSLTVEISDDIKFAFKVFNKSTWIDFTIHMDSKHRQNQYEAEIGNWKIGNTNLKWWENKLQGFQMIGDLFKKVVNLRINIKIDEGNNEDLSENLRLVVEWINSNHRGSVQICTVKGSAEIDDEDYRRILDNVHPTVSFQLFGKRSAEFQHDTFFKSYNLMLNGEWFTLDNLFATKCRDIWIYNSNYTYEDFTEYLSQWVAGRFSFLEFLHVKTQEQFDFEHINNELSNGSVRINEQAVKYIFIRGNESIILKRNDGLVAEILTPPGKTNTFDMSIFTS